MDEPHLGSVVGDGDAGEVERIRVNRLLHGFDARAASLAMSKSGSLALRVGSTR